MLDKIVSIIFFIVGIINLFPVVVFFSSAQTVKLYGTQIEGDSLIVLMRHRGILLGLIGLALIFAAVKPDVRIPVLIAAFISKIAFIYLVTTSVTFTPEIKQVAIIDVIAIVLLIVASVLHFYTK
jgi:hypothetical protein